MAEGSAVFTSDDDFELVGQALPFGIKTLEILLLEDPENPDLLLASCSGLTQYAYGWVELEAERLEDDDYAEARRLRARARNLYLRARGHCFRHLNRAFPGMTDALVRGDFAALEVLDAEDLPWLFWTGAAWGAAIATSLDQPELLADLPAVRALFERGLELDETWNRGALHDTLVVLSVAPPQTRESRELARRHYERAVELNGGLRAGSHLAYARAVAVPTQDRELFVELLERARAVDPDALPEERMVNILQQRRAEHLLGRVDDLFF